MLSKLNVFSAAFTGAGIHSATVPAISGAVSTRSQRSIESKSMESFFSARSEYQSRCNSEHSLKGVVVKLAFPLYIFSAMSQLTWCFLVTSGIFIEPGKVNGAFICV